MFKLITLSVLLVTLGLFSEMQPQALWIAAGLALSISGSLLVTLQKIGNRPSFAFTLLTFVCYSKSFWLQLNGDLSWWLPALLFASAVIVFFLMLPRLDSVVFPVLMMGMVLVQLCWAATQLYISEPSVSSNLACAAAYLFAISALVDVTMSNQNGNGLRVLIVSGSNIAAHGLLVFSVL